MCPRCCLDDPILHKCISAVFVIVGAALKHRGTCGTLWKGTVHPHFRPTRLKHRSNDIYVHPVFVYCLILLPCVLNQKQQLNLMFLQKLQQARVFKNLLVLKAKQLCCRYTWKDAAELQITGSGRWDVSLSYKCIYVYRRRLVSPPHPRCVSTKEAWMRHQRAPPAALWPPQGESGETALLLATICSARRKISNRLLYMTACGIMSRP